MATRENKVEKYLDDEVKRIGGLTYKWTGKPGVPDRIILYKGKTYFREIKTIDGKVSSEQVREIIRMKLQGVDVDIIFGRNQVDEFVKSIKC